MSHTTPSGLPVLRRGRHLDPRQGSCLMESVSVVARPADPQDLNATVLDVVAQHGLELVPANRPCRRAGSRFLTRRHPGAHHVDVAGPLARPLLPVRVVRGR